MLFFFSILLTCGSLAAEGQKILDRVRRAEGLIETYLSGGRRGLVAPQEWRRAAKVLQEMAEHGSGQSRYRARAAYCRASTLIEVRQFESAVPLYEECRQLDTNWAPCHLGLGIALTETRRLAHAEECFREGLRLRPKLAYMHRAVACIAPPEVSGDRYVA